MSSQRLVVLGTATSWGKAPFDDPSVRICSLNDAYSMKVPRIDEHYELHPLDQMWFRPKNKTVFKEHEVPKGVYIRPEGHLEWLQAQAVTIPIWLKDDPPAGWPINAQRFPLEAIEAKYGNYWASGPSYMLMHLYDRGFRDFAIYGIHLQTKQEYVDQKPNFEHLLGRLIGVEAKVCERDGLRIYEGRECVVRIPVEAPILTHGWKYGYEPKPQPVDAAARQRKIEAAAQHSSLAAKLVTWPRWKSKAKELAQLQRLRAVMRDADMQARHARVQAGVG